MRILMVTQWFNPEPMLKGLMFLEKLKQRGHTIQVLTGFPNYPDGNIYPGYRQKLFHREEIDGISVIRTPLYASHDANPVRRIANYASFALSSATIGALSIDPPDILYVYNPPATVALPAIVIKKMRRVPFLLEIQDLWPDTLGATGMMNNRVVLKMVDRWCKWTYRHASGIVVLSPGFKEMLVSRGVPQEKIEVIYNWCDEEKRILEPAPNPSLPEELGFNGRFNILYSGTMGKAQALTAVLKAAEILKDKIPEIRFVFVGTGIESEQLKNIAREKKLGNVVFFPRRPVEKIGEVLKIAEVLLVHLKDDPLFRITIPSKIQAYLAAGKPILAGVTGNAATLVTDARAGITCTPESPESIAEAAEKLFSMSASQRKEMGENGRKYYDRELSLDRGVDRYDAIFKRLAR